MISLAELLATRYRGVAEELEPRARPAARVAARKRARGPATCSRPWRSRPKNLAEPQPTRASAAGSCSSRPSPTTRTWWSCARSTLTFRTRTRVPPGTVLAFALVMEGLAAGPLRAPVVDVPGTARTGGGYIYEMRVSLEPLSAADLRLIALFIEKGRGAPQLAPGRSR